MRCASVPGYEAVVGRPLEVSVEAMNEEGRRVSFSAKGWQAGHEPIGGKKVE